MNGSAVPRKPNELRFATGAERELLEHMVEEFERRSELQAKLNNLATSSESALVARFLKRLIPPSV